VISSPAKAPWAVETSGMPAVSSSIRIAEPVAVLSMIAWSWAGLISRISARRALLISLYMYDAARLTVRMSSWSGGSVGSWASTLRVMASSSGSIRVTGWSVTGGFSHPRRGCPHSSLRCAWAARRRGGHCQAGPIDCSR